MYVLYPVTIQVFSEDDIRFCKYFTAWALAYVSDSYEKIRSIRASDSKKGYFSYKDSKKTTFEIRNRSIKNARHLIKSLTWK